MRVKVPIAVIDPATGNAIAGASVRLKKRSDGTDAVLYSAETGPTTATNPTTTDTYGRLSVWIDRGAYNATISGTGLTTFTQEFDAAPAADGSGETKWLATPDWVSSLPSAPVNGQEINFLADATNGIVWRLKYRSASASAFKWEYIGGMPMRNEGVGGTSYGSPESITTINFGTLTTPGPALTVPLAGDYIIEGKVTHVQPTAGAAPVHLLWVTGDGAPIWNGGHGLWSAGAASTGTIFSRRMRTLAAGNTVEIRYASTTAGTAANFYDRNLWLTPVRVG